MFYFLFSAHLAQTHSKTLHPNLPGGKKRQMERKRVAIEELDQREEGNENQRNDEEDDNFFFFFLQFLIKWSVCHEMRT